MTLLQTVILAVIEGLTEFLPISSTGHMILASNILKIPQTEFLKSFEIIIQLGAIAAVALSYWKKIYTSKPLWRLLAISFIPSAVVGFIGYKLIKLYLIGNTTVVAATLILGGMLLIISDKVKIKKDSVEGKFTDKKAFITGLAQAVSIIPGVSRSAATIMGATFQGINKKDAVEFSFMLAIPTMIAASALDIISTSASFSSNEYLQLGIGLLVAFITAKLAIKYFLQFLQSHGFAAFGWYRIVVGVLYLMIFR